MQGIKPIGINTELFTTAVKNEPIKNINSPQVKGESKASFSDVIEDAIYKVNDSQITANNKIESFIKGEDVTMHEVMLSMQESQMSMQLMLEVRNKLYEAYQEVNRVQM